MKNPWTPKNVHQTILMVLIDGTFSETLTQDQMNKTTHSGNILHVTPRVLTSLSTDSFHFETHKTHFSSSNPKAQISLRSHINQLSTQQYGPLITEHILILFPNISCSCKTQTLTRTTLSTSQDTETAYSRFCLYV